MTNNTKQSEETFIQWRIAGNPVVSGESASEAILTIHPDGRVTTSPRLKPDEISALVLDQIKTAWLKDAQATKIRELQDRIKHLRDGIAKQNQTIEQACGKVLGYPWFKDDQKNFPGSTEKEGVCVGDHVAETIVCELVGKYTEALDRIKRLEEAGDAMMSEPCEYTFEQWIKAKEAKP